MPSVNSVKDPWQMFSFDLSMKIGNLLKTWRTPPYFTLLFITALLIRKLYWTTFFWATWFHFLLSTWRYLDIGWHVLHPFLTKCYQRFHQGTEIVKWGPNYNFFCLKLWGQKIVVAISIWRALGQHLHKKRAKQCFGCQQDPR